jgi:alkanesulfonate monooxygenase SsuD/methylene tetrahydromethanopterin reductase-like flavin-dependent oxidoreductase (luciferase family)
VGLHLGQFAAPGGAPATRGWLREVATAVEDAGFDAIYVMDHFRQIPQVGRPFDDMLESWTTLAYLAACTERVRLGTLVSGITYRNVGHLGKIAATLDVLS